LAPLTDSIPKPMLKVAGRPILERIVLQLVEAGIRRVFLSVNHLSHLVESHFGDGRQFGCQIEYLREDRPLGTCGALTLLPKADKPILVLNGDLITQAEFGGLLDFHTESRHMATVGVRRYMHTVPFGCLDLDGTRITRIEEKPTLTKTISTGIYAIEPALLTLIPPATEFSMPNLLSAALAHGDAVGAWEVDGDWIDVGQKEQLQLARGEK
jgi:NDP-sugar pyrophosphorylase family protein